MAYSSVVVAVGLTLAVAAMPCSPVQATTYYVDDDNCPGPGTGTPADPYCSIQSGIDAASAGDTVQVAAGTYFETIAMKSGVVIQGAGQSVTTIDGEASGSVVTASGVDSAATLDGFTITNGGNTWAGGGMYNENSSPTVSHCTFSGNTASSAPTSMGGGMLNSNSSPTLTDCTFSGNEAAAYGGGMANVNSSSVLLTDCTFSQNTVVQPGAGGAIYNNASSLTLTSCTFSGNSVATGTAGAIFDTESTTTAIDSVFFENSAHSVGAVHSSSNSTLTFVNCIFNHNLVDDPHKGRDIATYGSLTLTNCTFKNTDPSIYNESPAGPIVTNCIFQGGVALTIFDGPGSSPAFVSCSLFPAYYAGTGNIYADPMFVDEANGDFRLRPGSPCIDAGDNSAPAIPATDMDGYDRMIDDPSVADTGYGTPPIVDMGAYEFDPLRLVFSDGFEGGSCASWSNAVGEAP